MSELAQTVVAEPSAEVLNYPEPPEIRLDYPREGVEVNGQSVFTHGVEIGVSRNETHDLQTATDELISSLSGGNPDLRRAANYSRISIGGRRGLRTTLTNRSEVSGQPETIEMSTTQLRDGSLFYVIGVAPTGEFRDYANVLNRVVGSIRLSD